MVVVYRWSHSSRPDRDKRAEFPTPLINADAMDPVQHPCDGKFYTSKSEFRKITKANGRTEIGNETNWGNPVEDKVSKTEIMESVQKLKHGYKPKLGEAVEGLDDSPTF